MQVLNETQIKQLRDMKRLIGSSMNIAWNEAVYSDEVESNEFLCKRKIILLLLDCTFRSIGLEGYRGFVCLKNSIIDKSQSNDGRFVINEDAFDLGNNIQGFYSHYMYQLGYESDEVNVAYVVEQLQEDTDISEIANDYGVADDIIEMIRDNEYISCIDEGELNIWHNAEIESFISDYEIDEFSHLKSMIDSVMEPVFMGIEEFRIQTCRKGLFEFGYLLFEVWNDGEEGISGLDFFLTDIIDAVLLHDQIQKIRQADSHKQGVVCHA